MDYISTRNTADTHSFEDILLRGLAHDGGLFMPEIWPKIEQERFEMLRGKPYTHVAASVLKPFTVPEISEDELALLVHQTYSPAQFEHSAVAPLIQIDSDLWILELFHGPTLAFKDYALQFLGRLFDHVLKQRGEKITIIGATSGDTGSAAIEACAGSDQVDIFILHPKDRTSEVQRKQMTTVDAPNVHNIALEGTFDDCQNMVKAMFADESFRSDLNLSAVNSINWARISAQIVYYVYAALSLGAPGKPVNFAVPTGNFGNILAAYCARKMGLPIDQLIIGTNENDILTRFFESGSMKTAEVIPTTSPSMDIQISSNFERYLFELMGRDAEKLKLLMSEFKGQGQFNIEPDVLKKAQSEFISYRCNNKQTSETIKKIHNESGYILDPHTAVGVHAAYEYKEQQNTKAPIVALACAHPAKFPDAVSKALGFETDVPERLSRILDLPEFVMPLPNDLEKVQKFVRQNVRI